VDVEAPAPAIEKTMACRNQRMSIGL